MDWTQALVQQILQTLPASTLNVPGNPNAPGFAPSMATPYSPPTNIPSNPNAPGFNAVPPPSPAAPAGASSPMMIPPVNVMGSAPATPGGLMTPQPITPMTGAPQPISPLAVGGQLPALPAGGLAGQGGDNWWSFLEDPAIQRALMQGGMRMLAASAPSTDPRSGSFGYALSEGFGGFQAGRDEQSALDRQRMNDEVNAAYKLAIAQGQVGGDGIKLQKYYDENGRETMGYWDAGQGRMVQVGGAKAATGGGVGGPGGGKWSLKKVGGKDVWVNERTMEIRPVDGLPGGSGQSDPYSDVVLQDVGRAIDLIQNSPVDVTGMAAYLTSGFAGTPAHDLDALIQTIKANVSFDRLQKMRKESPTGGALGNVSNYDIQNLQATIGNLSTSQRKEQLLENLRRVQQIYENIIHGTPEERAALAAGGGIGPQPGEVVDGYRFLGGDPGDPSNWETE